MAHGFDAATPETDVAVSPAVGPSGPVNRALGGLNYLIVIISSVALVIAAAVLSYSVVARYFLRVPTDWQDEISVFLIVGAIFMSAAAVQVRRGHIGIAHRQVNYINASSLAFGNFLFGVSEVIWWQIINQVR